MAEERGGQSRGCELLTTGSPSGGCCTAVFLLLSILSRPGCACAQSTATATPAEAGHNKRSWGSVVLSFSALSSLRADRDVYQLVVDRKSLWCAENPMRRRSKGRRASEAAACAKTFGVTAE